MLSSKELTRYSRNIFLDEVGRNGQERLKSSTVAVIGAGGLGSPALQYLAASGVGKILIIDSDNVDLTNLQRQVIYNVQDIRKSKAVSAKIYLQRLNPEIEIVSHETRLCRNNIGDILKDVGIILEGSDNFDTKFLVNDFAYLSKIPVIIAGILRFEGQVIGIHADKTACYRCIFKEPPKAGEIPACAEAGVLGSMAGVIGSIQATECIKYLLKLDASIFGSILQVDMKSLEFRKLNISKNKNCKLCGDNRTIHDLSHHPDEINVSGYCWNK